MSATCPKCEQREKIIRVGVQNALKTQIDRLSEKFVTNGGTIKFPDAIQMQHYFQEFGKEEYTKAILCEIAVKFSNKEISDFLAAADGSSGLTAIANRILEKKCSECREQMILANILSQGAAY